MLRSRLRPPHTRWRPARAALAPRGGAAWPAAFLREPLSWMSAASVGGSSGPASIASPASMGASGPAAPRPTFAEAPDRYGGVVAHSEGLDGVGPSEFEPLLAAALARWRSAPAPRGIWFQLYEAHGDLLGVLLRAGFALHHAGPPRRGRPGYVQTALWLGPGPSPLPPFAHHYVGVGGLVLRPDGTMLAITERHSLDAETRWKLPGGLVDPNERLCDAVVREVREETAVEATFEGLLSLRHSTRYIHGASDAYIVCLLSAAQDAVIAADPREIASACWMPVGQFLADPRVYPLNRGAVAHAVAHLARGAPLMEVHPEPVAFPGRPPMVFDLYRTRLEGPPGKYGGESGASGALTPEAAAAVGSLGAQLADGPVADLVSEGGDWARGSARVAAWARAARLLDADRLGRSSGGALRGEQDDDAAGAVRSAAAPALASL